MKLGQFLILGILGVEACAASAPSAVRRKDDRPGPAPPARITCDDQVAQVQPVPTGESREQYVWGCLIEHQFAAYLWERQPCETDDDCTVVETACPFGCSVAVAKTYAAAVSVEHDRLLAEFNKRADCKYKCNPVVGATCAKRRCEPRHLIE